MDVNALDVTELGTDVKKAIAHFTQAMALLKNWSIALTDEQRVAARKPPTAYFTEAPGFLRSVIAHPAVSAGSQTQPKEVLDYLQAIEVIAPANELASSIARLLDDTYTAWVDRAYRPSLEYYGVAKVLGKNNAELQGVVSKLSPIFPAHHAKKPAGDKTSGDKAGTDAADKTTTDTTQAAK